MHAGSYCSFTWEYGAPRRLEQIGSGSAKPGFELRKMTTDERRNQNNLINTLIFLSPSFSHTSIRRRPLTQGGRGGGGSRLLGYYQQLHHGALGRHHLKLFPLATWWLPPRVLPVMRCEPPTRRLPGQWWSAVVCSGHIPAGNHLNLESWDHHVRVYCCYCWLPFWVAYHSHSWNVTFPRA